jgi:hypothetical protein
LQVLLLCGLLKDQHSNQQWRSATAAVFVEARTLEQDICSDLPLQQGLLLACQQIKQQQQQQEDGDGFLSKVSTDSTQSSSSSSSSYLDDPSTLVRLSKALLKHMQLEGLSPLGFAGLKPNQDTEPQVLSVAEQASILSGLQAEQRLLVKRMQDLLLSSDLAPVVTLDAESLKVLMEPLQQQQQQPPAAGQGRAPPVTSTQTGQIEQPAAAAAEDADLVLNLGLVQQLLAQHPSPEVSSGCS